MFASIGIQLSTLLLWFFLLGKLYRGYCELPIDFVCFVYSTMPSDSMDDIELKNIQLQFPNARTLSRDDSSVLEERVETGGGNVLVAVQGNRSKPAILTYHDLGLNCEYMQRSVIGGTYVLCSYFVEVNECRLRRGLG
jgi:hypothetical protein